MSSPVARTGLTSIIKICLLMMTCTIIPSMITVMGGHMSAANSLVQFSFQEVTASELQRVIDAPIERTGPNLDSYLSIRCVTEHQSARPGVDYVERSRDDPNSVVVFLPGERTKSCGVRLLDDREYEPTETFLIHLKSLRSSLNRDRTSVEHLGSNRTVLVRIIDDEDTPTVEFQRSNHSIEVIPSEFRDSAISTLLMIVRSGVDLNHMSKVRVRTQDTRNSAIAALDYRSIDKVVTFQSGDRVQLVDLVIIHHRDSFNESSGARTFKVNLLEDQDLINCKLGNLNWLNVTVFISQSQTNQKDAWKSRRKSISSLSPLEPEPLPIVVSLMKYANLSSGTRDDVAPPAGHPLICVTPSDPRHPDHHHDSANINHEKPINLTSSMMTMRFFWEVADPSRNHSKSGNSVANPIFRRLVSSILFARVDRMVLDSIHFRPGLLVRCVTQRTKVLKSIKSPTIEIGEGSCQSYSSTSDHQGLQTEPFVATLKYTPDSQHRRHHANRLHVHIEIPHQDGMLPLVSTRPLHNLTLLLDPDSDVRRTRVHPCSNLLMPGDRDSILNDGFFKFDDLNHDGVSIFLNESASYSGEFDSKLRSNETVLLYRHLNRNRCRWTFDAWYHMAELTELCGGYTLGVTDHGDHRQTTVRIPLYVSYVFVSDPDPTIVERHTEMDFTFEYNSIAWSGSKAYSANVTNVYDRDVSQEKILRGKVHVQRIAIGDGGKMVIDFQTRPNFKGLFVVKNRKLPNFHSRLLPPANLILSFDLHLLWTARTYDGPMQTWRAISNYSLKDYSGTYILELIPCTVDSYNRVFGDINISLYEKHSDICTPHLPIRYELPIEFQQTNRPVAIVYSLNTHFELMNDEREFLLPPTSGNVSNYASDDEHNSWTFSKDENILGRVLWHPNHDLRSAYRLVVKRVYGCTGRDGYIPVYDPLGQEYDKGPQYGCIRPNKQLSHRIILLDRNDQGAGRFDAKFAEDVPKYHKIREMPGVDGFVVPVNILYNIEADERWFIQAVYTIDAAEAGAAGIEHRHRSSRSVKSVRNGTNVRSLWLNKNNSQETIVRHSISNYSYVPIVVLVLIVIAIAIVVVALGLVTLKRIQQADLQDYPMMPSSSSSSSATSSSSRNVSYKFMVVTTLTEKQLRGSQGDCSSVDEDEDIGTEV